MAERWDPYEDILTPVRLYCCRIQEGFMAGRFGWGLTPEMANMLSAVSAGIEISKRGK